MQKLTVWQDENGRFFCEDLTQSGMAVQGSGASVLEAVGSWAIYSKVVEIYCHPPAVLNEFTIANKYTDLKFKSSYQRD